MRCATSVAGDPLPTAPPVERIHVHAPEAPTRRTAAAIGRGPALRGHVLPRGARRARSPASRPCGRASATRSSWSAGTACSTATSTPTTSGQPSRRPSTSAGRATSASPTSPSRSIEERWVREGALAHEPGDDDHGPAPTTAVVAVVQGDGVGRIFRSLGVRGLVTGGQSMNPSTAELLEAVMADGQPTRSCSCPTTRTSSPSPSRSPSSPRSPCTSSATASIVEGFAALLAYDPDATGDANADVDGGLGEPRDRRGGDPGRARHDDRPSARSARATGSGSPAPAIGSIAESVAVCRVRAARRRRDRPATSS